MVFFRVLLVLRPTVYTFFSVVNPSDDDRLIDGSKVPRRFPSPPSVSPVPSVVNPLTTDDGVSRNNPDAKRALHRRTLKNFLNDATFPACEALWAPVVVVA
jgi:hypothetical protein